MIVYNLRCKNTHEFEGWFRDSAAFEDQAASRKLVCPVCETRKVEKAIMAPALSAAVGKEKSAPAPEEMRKLRQFMTGLRKHITENADYVGKEFPEEARKIHYGEIEERPIYGEATIEEARDLAEEGVDVAPLPPDLSEAN
ncbi:MAG TPA: DUF1178 family protein [Rhizomicrobium sp.]|jgi:hypothetical protein